MVCLTVPGNVVAGGPLGAPHGQDGVLGEAFHLEEGVGWVGWFGLGWGGLGWVDGVRTCRVSMVGRATDMERKERGRLWLCWGNEKPLCDGGWCV